MANDTWTWEGRRLEAQLHCQVPGVLPGQYMAISADPTPCTMDDTDITDGGLYPELGRVIVSRLPAGVFVVYTAFFGLDVLNTTWKKLGIFGNGATAQAGTGTLIACANIDPSYVKVVLKQVQYDFTLSF